MDDRMFDQMATNFGDGQSRRSLVRGFAGGGLAALLAAVSLGGSIEDAEAARCRNCRKKAGAARRRCLKRCKKTTGAPPPNNPDNGVTIGIGLLGLGAVCSTSTECASGNCAGIVAGLGTCRDCHGVRLCGDVCCLLDAKCVANTCLFPQV